MKNMIIASKDSLFLVNNSMFFKRFGYKVSHANDYIHALNNIKTLCATNEKIDIMIVKIRSFSDDDSYQLEKILAIDSQIKIIIVSNTNFPDNENLKFIDYYSSPMEIVENLNKQKESISSYSSF